MIAIFISLPVTVSILAVLLSRQIISPGSEWSAVITIVSLYFAAFGAVQTYEGRKASQQMRDISKEKEEKRKYVLAEYEIPHVVYSLKIIRLEMGRTVMVINTHSVNGVIQTSEGVEQIHRRIITHIESIRLLSSTFFSIDLSEHHKHLNTVLANLNEIAFLSQNDKVDITKLKESMYMVSRVIELISDEWGIDPMEI